MCAKLEYKPRKLGEKLRRIRYTLGLSHVEMVRRLGVGETITYSSISLYEAGMREPPLSILLAYARLAQVHLEKIVDDELELPRRLPGTFHYGVARRARKSVVAKRKPRKSRPRLRIIVCEI